MKIGIDATTIYTAKPTGLGVYSINMINELARIHDDIVVWTVDDSALKVEPSKIRLVLQPFRFLGDHLFQLRALWVEMILPSLIRAEGVDVLYSTIPNGLASSRVPHVVTVHDLIPLAFPSDSPRTVRWNFHYRIPRILDKAAWVIAVSDYTRQDVIKNYSVDPEKVVTVSEGFDRDNFFPGRDETVLRRYNLCHKGYILYVGSSTPRKNVAGLIRSYAQMAPRIAQQLVLVGPKSPLELHFLREIILEHRITDRVKLINYVPHADLPAIYSSATLFLFLSFYEGFGLPLLEAMACGTPVVASFATSLPEVAGDAAMLVDPNDLDAISGAVELLVNDEERLKHMKSKGLARSALFSWESAARQVLDLLKRGPHFSAQRR